ncbi:apolipoprotein N-acyltransferase [Antarcticimicrobium luteum]|uniref:Apolipoprotein N-acyltransferase n=1 Tax=Antarcticimicrobium luteum TaxID=2547397 RepID=A0A4R5VE21_9RHOB|nr:apolipoprotein N-acyltransferase [Antarcticimicrobium luteum]TDK50600.1 apolipoprotein N-acyltransferase [Antarcticimicrobium luteum]
MTLLCDWSLRRRLLLAAVAGAAGALGLAPFGLWPVTLIAVALMPALLLSCDTPRAAALTGWAFGAGWFAHALSWIVEPFLVDPDRYAWMAPFALLFLAGGLALFWGGAFWVARRAAGTSAGRIAALVVALSLAEFARAFLLTGFPWAAVAQVWVGTPADRLLAWIGPQGLALTTLIVAVLPGWALARRVSVRGWALCLLPAVAMAVAALATGRQPPVAGTGAIVRVIQPNAPQHQKWDPAYIPVFFQRQIAFTEADPRPDLIVWPESAVPVLLEEAAPTLARIAEAARGADVVLGIQRFEGRRVYNSLIRLDGAGEVAGLYDKHHLVPFGEYVPLGDLAAEAGVYGFAAREGQGYSAGPGPRLLDLGRLGAALPLICYEAVFPQDVTGTPERPRFLLQLTNDAWFGTRAGPYQHLAQARMRAIEQGLPMVRAANTGISAVVGPHGELIRSIPLGEAGYADAELPAPLPPTVYARTGDWPVFLLLLIVGSALLVVQWRRGSPT